MTTLLYDGSFDGLFTAVFEVFEYRFDDAEIISKNHYTEAHIFAVTHEVITDEHKASRVLKKLEQNLGKEGIRTMMKLYFSENKQFERLVLSVVRQSIEKPQQNILQNYADDDVLEISKICKSVGREIHRMHAFIRFEKLKDEVYFAKISPDFNVLPLIWKHFLARYKDQKWMIFDLKRHYGIFYDLQQIQFFYPEEYHRKKIEKSELLHHEDEKNYQQLWQRYFVKTGIPERRNMKLHIQWMPKRYWKYLTEKLNTH